MSARQKSSSYKTARISCSQSWLMGKWLRWLMSLNILVHSSTVIFPSRKIPITFSMFTTPPQMEAKYSKIFWKLWIIAWWKAFYLLTWSCGNLNLERRIKLQKIVNMTSKILGKPQKQLSRMYYELLRGKSDKIINDPSWQWVHCTVNLNFCHQEDIIDWQRQIGISARNPLSQVLSR